MAITKLHPESAPATASLEENLTALTKRASVTEDALRRAAAVLDAIDHGGLLDAAPTRDPGDYERHCTATNLLSMLRDELRRIEEIEGTELSISLSVLANKAKSGSLTA